MKHQTPLSERARAGDRIDPDELAMLERIAANRAVQVAVNGKDPRDWTLERWMSVLKFIGVVVAGVIGTVWMLGGNATRFMEEHKAILAGLTTLNAKIEAVQEEQRRVLDELLAADLLQLDQAREIRRRPTPRPAWPRSESLLMGQPEDR